MKDRSQQGAWCTAELLSGLGGSAMVEMPSHHIMALLLSKFSDIYKDQESLCQAVAEHREFDRKLTYIVALQTLPAVEGLDFTSFNSLGKVKWMAARLSTERYRQGLFDKYQGQPPWVYLQEADPKKRPLDKIVKEFPDLADETEFQRLFTHLRDFEGRVRFLSILIIIHMDQSQWKEPPDLVPRPYTLQDCKTSDSLLEISAHLGYDFTSIEHHLLHLAFLMSLFLAESDELRLSKKEAP